MKHMACSCFCSYGIKRKCTPFGLLVYLYTNIHKASTTVHRKAMSSIVSHQHEVSSNHHLTYFEKPYVSLGQMNQGRKSWEEKLQYQGSHSLKFDSFSYLFSFSPNRASYQPSLPSSIPSYSDPSTLCLQRTTHNTIQASYCWSFPWALSFPPQWTSWEMMDKCN